MTAADRDDYNRRFGRQVDDFRTFVNTHYLGGRSDTPFWREFAQNRMHQETRERLELWRREMPRREHFPDVPQRPAACRGTTLLSGARRPQVARPGAGARGNGQRARSSRVRPKDIRMPAEGILPRRRRRWATRNFSPSRAERPTEARTRPKGQNLTPRCRKRREPGGGCSRFAG